MAGPAAAVLVSSNAVSKIFSNELHSNAVDNSSLIELSNAAGADGVEGALEGDHPCPWWIREVSAIF